MRYFNLGLGAKLNIIIALAIIIPLLIVSGLMFQTIRNITLDNLENFVQESGSRRQATIENDLRASLNTINEFLNANQGLLNEALEQQNTGILDVSAEANRDDIESRFQTELLGSGYYHSVRLLTFQYFPYATASQQSQNIPNTFQVQRSAISAIADRIDIEQGDTQVFGVTNRDDIIRVEVLTALISTTEAGSQDVLGYLLVDLNLDEIFINNLQSTDASFDTYAYVILPQTNVVIAPDSVIQDNLIDTDSIAARRALANRASASEIYSVNTEEGQREVVGYSTAFIVDNESFALITEISTSAIFDNIAQNTLSQIFVATLAITSIILIFSIFATNQMVIPPIERLRTAILGIIRGDLDIPLEDVERNDELGSLAISFVDMRDYIQKITQDMNQRLEERTRDVKITQDISQAIASERDLNTLLSQVVDLIIKNFPSIYHAQIFLVDDSRTNAVLRASTGAAGRELLSRGHRLGVGSVSVIGQVTEQGQVMIARDTAESSVHRQNEFLGDTRAELAIPLRLGNTVIGALDVQSKQRNSFDKEQVSTLQTLADQITTAIDNARLYAETQRLLNETQIERRRLAQGSWQEYLNQQRKADLLINSGTNTGYNFKRLSDKVLETGEPAIGEITNRNTIPFAVPIMFREQILGVAEYEMTKDDFSYDKVLLARDLVSRLAISLENARLFDASQQVADRERVVNDISAKLTNQTDIESILETAVREIERALRTPQVAINLSNGNGKNPNGNDDIEG
ncbi:MAG: hypothetical protein Phog2KO_06780 [Phototrophicaceae bacterium]